MDEARFWELIDLLGGVADDDSVGPLRAALAASGDGEDFEDEVESRVAALRDTCGFPDFFRGSDLGECLGAAVVAAGRTTYESTLAAGRRLDEGAWDWEEAEVLLVAGGPGDTEYPNETERLISQLGIRLQWRSTTEPDGVDTDFDPDFDFGDDPAWGGEILEDDEWSAALTDLERDSEFRRRRATLRGVGLHLVVRDADEVLLMAFPHDDAVADVVMILPTQQVLAAESRRSAYVEGAVMLVSAVQDAAGIDPGR